MRATHTKCELHAHTNYPLTRRLVRLNYVRDMTRLHETHNTGPFRYISMQAVHTKCEPHTHTNYPITRHFVRLNHVRDMTRLYETHNTDSF